MVRLFKFKSFKRDARKAGISDADLQKAFAEAMEGKADDLGGGVFKKRLNENRHRSILLMKGRERWFYVYLFAKADMENIEEDELREFRKQAEAFAKLKDEELAKLVEDGRLIEITPVEDEEEDDNGR